MNDLSMYSEYDLRQMIWFYRRGPRRNSECRKLIRRIIAELRSRKVAN